VYPCSNPTVIIPARNFSATTASYEETFTCTLPDTGMPASSNCEAVVELAKLGASGAVGKSNAKFTVHLEVDAGYPQPAAGSMAGGHAVTIQGRGKQVAKGRQQHRMLLQFQLSDGILTI
jgi:hypothetical protein